jgi:DNA-directed RNA polymerase specialized sigma24 family protein
MKLRNTIRREAAQTREIEQLLAAKYSQLQRWAAVLTRGDSGTAQELVQEFCLYFTLTKPDLTAVADQDGYLYTCLRNIYLSGLARASREALHLVSVADYDSFDFALAANPAGDSLQKQNDLRRICAYAVWRKEQSKSASYFILHFFHGYARREIAEMARLPISAIYNKLKTARDEVKSYLSQSGKLRIVDRHSVPPPRSSWSLLPTADFFTELRQTILSARLGVCLDEAALLAHYASSTPSPIPCALLAHIVSCERCLNSIDSHFRRPALRDREPMDGFGPSSENVVSILSPNLKAERSMLASVRKRWSRIKEHRPRTLSIAVNGKIIAFYDVQSQQSTLSARIENPEREQFVEVFSEQDVRLALMPVSELPPQGPHTMTQRVTLSDSRWLELKLTFDGLGLNSQVVYCDPALAPASEMDALWQDTDEPAEPVPMQMSAPPASHQEPHLRRALVAWVRQLASPLPRQAAAWALGLVMIFASGGYAAYRYTHPGWRDILARAQAVAEAALPGETLHQTLRIEEAMGPAPGTVLGSVDVWRSADRRVIWRLYNVHQTLLATSIDSGRGAIADHYESDASITVKEREMAASGVWRTDLSSTSFDTRDGAVAEAVRASSGFEVTQREGGRNGVLSRTLVLDRNYKVEAERIRFSTAGGTSDVRLVQTLLRKVRNKDVPAWTFPQSEQGGVARTPSGSALQHPGSTNPSRDADGANLEVMLLFELFRRNADIGQPIEVTPLTGGRIRMTGTLGDAQLLAAIRKHVAALPQSSRIDFQIRSVKEAATAVHRGTEPSQELVGSASDAPATSLVRDALVARGLKEPALKNAEQEFAASALSHAQAALQHAYALDRLGNILERADGASLDSDSRVKWAQMVDRHSAEASAEFQALRLQLNSVAASSSSIPSVDVLGIADAAQFVHATADLRIKAQSVNEEVVKMFAGSTANMPPMQAKESMARLQTALPIVEVGRIHSFSGQLVIRNSSTQNDVGEMQSR